MAVIVFTVAALTVTGFTSPTTNTGTSSPATTSTSTSAAHDAQLAQYMDAFNQTEREVHPNNLTAYHFT